VSVVERAASFSAELQEIKARLVAKIIMSFFIE
jgi:hypothetical protein